MSNQGKLYSTHVLVSLIFLITLLGVLFASRNFILDILLVDVQTNVKIILVLFIIVAVSLSFIFYLLLTFNSRFNLEIWNETKDLAFSKQQFKRLYESAPIPYVMLDGDGNMHEPNKAALRFFGSLTEDIENKNFFSFVSDDSKEKAGDLFAYFRSKVSINRKEVQMMIKDGTVRSVMISVFDMRGPGSYLSTGLAVIMDITEQKLIEKAKTEFLSLAAHQLKTPLATTKWYTDMLFSGDIGVLNDEQKKYMTVLHVANQNMVELVDVLLNISRIEMGSLAVEKVPTNVQDLLESIKNEFALQINLKKINLVVNYNGLFESIESDPKLFRIVIQNLVSNAIKYTPDGGTISINFEESSNERRIVVSDTGFGIPIDQQDRIFSKLFRADNVKKLSSSQGTGLGLYLVKSIIVSMGGDIRFSSEENKGSIFTITF